MEILCQSLDDDAGLAIADRGDVPLNGAFNLLGGEIELFPDLFRIFVKALLKGISLVRLLQFRRRSL